MNTHPIRLLVLGPTVAAAVLLGAAPAISSSGSVSPTPVTISGERIELANTSLEFLPLKPRGDGTDVETAEEAWEHIPGGPGSGRLPAMSEGTIKSECKDAGGSYGTRTGEGGRVSTCSYHDIDGGYHKDYFGNGVYSHTEDADGNVE